MIMIRTLSLLWISGFALYAQNTVPGTGLPSALFQLREMDMHLHSGMERPIEMNSWLDLAVQDGRKVVTIIDHLELYRKTPEDYEAWRTKGKFQARYPVGTTGQLALMDDFVKTAAARRDLIIFRAWEVYEGELDSGLQLEPMEKADLIGFHISPNNGSAPPHGRMLIQRARQALEMQHRLAVPVVLLHPFPMRVENLVRQAQKAGRDPNKITTAEFRFFAPGEQDELARILKGSSVYVEIGLGTTACFQIETCRAAMIADIRPLAEAGVQFTVSTDAHNVNAARREFNPQEYCDALSVRPSNTNTIVRELLALRAKRNLQSK